MSNDFNETNYKTCFSSLQVNVVDGGKPFPRTGETTVTILVEDVNDKSPKFEKVSQRNKNNLVWDVDKLNLNDGFILDTLAYFPTGSKMYLG